MTEVGELQRGPKESDMPIREIRERVLQAFMILSHDLRGPLVAISAGLELLARGMLGRVDESAAKRLGCLLRQTVRLSGIVDDHLARAAVMDGFGEVRKEPLDLRKDIIDPIMKEFADLILSGRIVIEEREGAVSEGITVHASGRLLKCVYRNLITNAVKYGAKGCVISLGCEDHGRYYRLNIYNSGEPVPEELRYKLFSKFCGIGNTAGNPAAGAGLGLYLVREIIRKHGGDIWYEATQTGSNFFFMMPKDKD